MRGTCLVLWLGASLPGVAADDFKVIELEQDMIELERRVEALSRDVEQLQQRGLDQPTARAATAGGDCPAAQPCSPAWLSVASWERVRPGMSEFEVIGILGPPSSVRGAADSPTRTLMYAMEIGSNAFLAGRVDLEEHRVVAIQTPVLR
jgi:hypothetical protein